MGEPEGGRAELAVREGERVPEGLPDGDCVITRLADDSLRIDRADPRILVSAELLESIADGVSPWASVVPRAAVGAVLKIRGVNREVVYRITGYIEAVRGYIAERPD